MSERAAGAASRGCSLPLSILNPRALGKVGGTTPGCSNTESPWGPCDPHCGRTPVHHSHLGVSLGLLSLPLLSTWPKSPPHPCVLCKALQRGSWHSGYRSVPNPSVTSDTSPAAPRQPRASRARFFQLSSAVTWPWHPAGRPVLPQSMCSSEPFPRSPRAWKAPSSLYLQKGKQLIGLSKEPQHLPHQGEPSRVGIKPPCAKQPPRGLSPR